MSNETGPPFTINIRWDEGRKRPIANPDPATIKIGSGSQNIEWTTNDSSIAKFDNHELEKHSEFKNQRRSSDKRTVTIEDTCTKTGQWSYTITATHQSGITGSHDPKIANEST